jgi:hypothetical protein
MSFGGSFPSAARCISLILFVCFAVLMKRHEKLFRKLAVRKEFLRQAEHGLARLACNFSDIPRPIASDLFEADHPFAFDLDFNASNSVFKLFGDIFHRQSAETLVSWFNHSSDAGAILERQQAVAELADQPKFMRHFRCRNRLQSRSDWRVEDTNEWTSFQAPRFLGVLAVVGLPLAALSTVMLCLSFFFGIQTPWRIFLSLQVCFFLFSAGYLKSFIRLYRRICPVIGASSDNLLVFSGKSWSSSLLRQCHSGLGWSHSALQRITSFGRKLDQALSVRDNGFAYLTLNLFFQWDVYYAFRLKSWKKKTDPHLADWIETLFLVEALSSLGGFSHLFPKYVFPEIMVGTGEPLIESENMGHPCIPEKGRVCNEFRLSGGGKTQLLTGSNMSGKSTFLRTVGVNWALALAGAPCCASEMVCTPVPIWTSMRIQDSLAQGSSYFYAEVVRLKRILDSLISTGRPVFYLLDEILKGTNSHERFLATRALVSFLRKQGASGMISTHDLELLKLTGSEIENYHFSELIQDGKMTFDYRLKKGCLQSTNALRVIELVGLPLHFFDVDEP